MPSIRANNLTFEYREEGDPAAPAMLLIMGLGVQLTFWPEEFCRELTARGFRVVRFDNRDVGLSSKLDHLGTPNIALEAMRYAMRLPMRAPYLVEDMAGDALAVMDALGLDRAHVIGASMGGMIAQNLAARVPARVRSLTSIMSTTGSRRLPSPNARAFKALLAMPAAPGDTEGAIRRMMHLLRTIGSRTYPPDEGWLRAFVERNVRRCHHPAGGARQLLAIAASGDRTGVVERIRVPTLVVHGDEDPLLRQACGAATAAAVRAGGGEAHLEIVRGMGHDLPLPLQPRIADAIAAHCRASG